MKIKNRVKKLEASMSPEPTPTITVWEIVKPGPNGPIFPGKYLVRTPLGYLRSEPGEDEETFLTRVGRRRRSREET